MLIPNVGGFSDQLRLVIWLSGLEFIFRLWRPLAPAFVRTLARRFSGFRLGALLPEPRRAEVNTHILLTNMMTKNSSIVTALLIVLGSRAAHGEDVLGRSLVPAFSIQLIFSVCIDLFCFHFETNYLEADLTPHVLSEYRSFWTVLFSTGPAILISVSVLLPTYSLVLG
jgi:hypothetical protein